MSYGSFSLGSSSFGGGINYLVIISISVSDAGSGVDAIAVKAKVSLVESGTGVDLARGFRPISIIESKYKNALSFDGVDDYVSLPSIFTVTNYPTATFAFWYLKTTLTSGWQSSIGHTNTANYYGMRVDFTTAGDIYAGIVQNTIAWLSVVTTPSSLGVWHFVTLVSNSNQISLYLDGTLKGTATTTAGTGINYTGNWYLGQLSSTLGEQAFKGIIDEVRIYNRALSANEIYEHYKGIFRDESGLVGLWHFDEGSGIIANDSSGQGKHGTLVNDPTWVSSTIPIGGSGIDAISWARVLSILDLGVGSEVLDILRKIFIVDSGVGVDLIPIIKAKLLLVESGAGVDAIKILSKILLQDSGAGIETIAIKSKLTISDLGVGSDISKVLAKLSILDLGVGADTVRTLGVIKIFDSGAGIDLIAKILAKVLIKELGKGVDRIKVPRFYSDKYLRQATSYTDKYLKKNTVYSDKYF